MSPEQARGGAIDGRSDLFSVGCVLYEMVAGQRAFRGDSITALLFKIITEEPPSLRELDPTVSDEMLRIIAKALSKAPETRYQSGRELADDLLAITRPGYVPTLRARETPTLPPDAPPGDVPTISSPPTAQALPTIASAETAAKAPCAGADDPHARDGARRLRRPCHRRPCRRHPCRRTKKAASAPARSAPPAAAAPRRKGGGAGLIVGLGVVGLLLVAVVAGGAYFLMRGRTPRSSRHRRRDARAVSAPATTGDVTPPQPAEAVPPAVRDTRPPSAEPAARPTQPAPAPAAPTVPAPPAATAASRDPHHGHGSPSQTEPAGAEFAHLDELPSDEGDGRAAGAAAGRSYSQGGTSGFGTPEALRHSWQRAARSHAPGAAGGGDAALPQLGRGSLPSQERPLRNARELADAGLLALDVPFDANGFKRTHYAFRVTVEADGYRAEAIPQAPIGRAFIVDDTGKVQLPD